MGESAAREDAPAGRTRPLGGRYELGDLIGIGGMAVVRLATDLRLDRTVAVKMLRGELAEAPAFQARFRREARAAAALNHPAVVSVYDAGEDSVDGATASYIVMEYVEGQTLRQLVRSGPLDVRRAAEIAAAVLDALACSHSNGVVHRDVKPANVMIASDGAVKVMDFGVARAVADVSASLTQTSAVIGTAHYLSPEQARGDLVDARSDIYSAGCLLHELLTGRPPFQGDSAIAVAYQHVREPAQPPSAFAPQVPPELDAVVLAALSKDREERYQSADQMRADLLAWLAGDPVVAPVVAPVAPAPTGALPLSGDAEEASVTRETPIVDATAVAPGGWRRRRLVLVGAAAAVMLVAVLGGLALSGGGEDPQTRRDTDRVAQGRDSGQDPTRSAGPAGVDPVGQVGLDRSRPGPGTVEPRPRRADRPEEAETGDASRDVRETRDEDPGVAARPEPGQAPEPASTPTSSPSPEESAPEEEPSSEPPAESPEPEPSTTEPEATTTEPAPQPDGAP